MKSKYKHEKGEDMFLESDYSILEEVIDSYFDKTKIDRPSKKTDIYKLANDMQFEVKEAIIKPFKGVKVEGVLLVDEDKKNIGDKFSGYRGIALNYLNKSRDNRFIVAHELSHYIFEKYLNDYKDVVLAERRFEHIVGHERDDFEQAIDYMGAAILIPQKQFSKQYKEAKEKKQSMQDFVEEMSLYYDLPDKAIEKRIKELSILEPTNK